MERREFMTKTGVGLAGIMASGTGLVSAVEATVAGHGQEKAQRVIEGHQGLDFSVVREDFPPLARMRAYLDTAFVGLMPRQVKAAHDKFLEERLQFGPMGTDQSILGVWLGKTEQVRVKVAQFLGAQTNELAFTMCTGCGSNIALNGINWHRGDNAIIDDLEYPTDFHVLNAIKKKGVEIRIARHKNGMVSPETFAALADTRTRAIVVTHVSYLNGFRHDLKKLADIIHSFGG
ncbi:MAG: aminotransferase class V-fold PLP-dependent enzyme, partial [Planctomycetes bacterium]|nr:aminotransferase class V-fold PLP-dependent enzyme [Planctomycetota bacterium]